MCASRGRRTIPAKISAMPNLSQAPLLVFIGFMGAGKSTIGRLLATQTGAGD